MHLWINDPNILIHQRHRYELYPDKSYCKVRRINAITRLIVLFLIIVGLTYAYQNSKRKQGQQRHHQVKWSYYFLISVVIIFAIFMYAKSLQEHELECSKPDECGCRCIVPVDMNNNSIINNPNNAYNPINANNPIINNPGNIINNPTPPGSNTTTNNVTGNTASRDIDFQTPLPPDSLQNVADPEGSGNYHQHKPQSDDTYDNGEDEIKLDDYVVRNGIKYMKAFPNIPYHRNNTINSRDAMNTLIQDQLHQRLKNSTTPPTFNLEKQIEFQQMLYDNRKKNKATEAELDTSRAQKFREHMKNYMRS